MVKTKFKKAVSLMLAAVMSLTAFTGIGATTAFAAVGEKADVYLVDYPRSGDTNNNGEWGHGNLNYMNGWKGLSTKYTGLRAMGSYSGNIAYCIEPGTGQRTGDTLTEKDENFFNNISPNGTISGDDIRLLIGRILQYGYRGGISTSWKSQNESDANCIAHAYATQILIWETIVGERDAGFNHVSTSGYNAVLECVSTAHPLRSKILSYYNSMVTSVQNHTKVPSFCTRSSGSAKVNELEWNGSKYVATLTDTNGVLGNYNFSANIDGVSFSVSGNKLTVSMEKAPSKEFTITAAKKNGVRRGVVVWSDGIHQNGNGIQDVVTYAQEVSDPVSGFVKMKVSYGSCQIVKTSEDGKVDGIQFTISGNGVNQTVTTANGGKFQLDNLIFIDEIYLLFQHEYSANFLFTLWKRVRKYGAYATGITQNVDDLLQSHTARTMLANSEFLIMLNQASTDRIELAKLLNISDLQLSYITNVDAGHGLIKVGSSLVPFANKFPKNTKLYKLMTTKPGEGA